MSQIFVGGAAGELDGARERLAARLAVMAEQNIAIGPAVLIQLQPRTKIMSEHIERRRMRRRREVLQERRYREFEEQAAIFAASRGEALSPVPESGVALKMAKLLAGQALIDPGARRILENLGLHPGELNSSWRGPVYTGDPGPEEKALGRGRREKTSIPRVRR
jgi:hypothetical protein